MPQTLRNGIAYTVAICLTSTSSYDDITSSVMSVTINRGRSRQLDSFNAGSATIVLLNNDRKFDPSATSSPYYGGVVPRRAVRVTVAGTVIYEGFVADYNVDYEPGSAGFSTVTVTCTDYFSILSMLKLYSSSYSSPDGTVIPAWTLSSELTGARISSVISRLSAQGTAITASTSIGTGYSTVGSYTVSDGTVALDYLQSVNVAEQGYFFMSRSGVLTFKDRGSIINVTPTTTFSDTGSVGTVPYQEFGVQYGTEFLYNYVITQRTGSTTNVSSDTASITAYQPSTLQLDNLLVSTDTQAQDIGAYLLSKYKSPELRFDKITVKVKDSTATYTGLMTLDIGQTITVTKTFTTGTPSSLSKVASIEGVSHSVTPDMHSISYTLGWVDGRTFLILDDATYGTLDGTNRLFF